MDENTEQRIIERLDYMERYLVNLGQVAGYRYAPLQADDQPSFSSGPASPGQDAGSFGAAPAGYDAEPSFGPLMPPAGGLGLPADVVAMAQAGRLAKAAKTYRDRTGVSLQEAYATVRTAARGY